MLNENVNEGCRPSSARVEEFAAHATTRACSGPRDARGLMHRRAPEL